MKSGPFSSRTLSGREGAIVAWLEAERRPAVTVGDVADTFDWPRPAIHDVLSRLEHKGWLRRTARGRYETVLAETGGFAPPNPWTALSTWGQRYYVGFQSAAYEHGLTPDRPGTVQAAAPVGAKAPRAWAEVPVTLVMLRRFSLDGVVDVDRHGVTIAVATPEKLLVDASALPGRVGGPQGLARIADRAVADVDWDRVVQIARGRGGGTAALRRLAATLELIEHDVPASLAAAAVVAPGTPQLYLGERRLHGARGRRLRDWAVVDNVGGERLRQEIER
jgi:predicted transcriptional regulator of viral defense system